MKAAPPSKHSHLDDQAPDQNVLTIQECKVVGSSKGKSFWDPNFNILAHGESCFLLDEDKACLMAYGKDHLRQDSNMLFGQAFSFACLANVKAKDRKKAEDRRAQQNVELHQDVERLHAKVNRLGLELANKTQEGFVFAKENSRLSNEIEDL